MMVGRDVRVGSYWTCILLLTVLYVYRICILVSLKFCIVLNVYHVSLSFVKVTVLLYALSHFLILLYVRSPGGHILLQSRKLFFFRLS